MYQCLYKKSGGLGTFDFSLGNLPLIHGVDVRYCRQKNVIFDDLLCSCCKNITTSVVIDIRLISFILASSQILIRYSRIHFSTLNFFSFLNYFISSTESMCHIINDQVLVLPKFVNQLLTLV